MIFYITSPQGEDTGETAKTVQKANSHDTGLNPNTPPLDKKYKASLVWEHRDLSDTALHQGILPPLYNGAHAHTHAADRTGSGSFGPLTFREPLGPCHDAQTTHCTKIHKHQSACKSTETPPPWCPGQQQMCLQQQAHTKVLYKIYFIP